MKFMKFLKQKFKLVLNYFYPNEGKKAKVRPEFQAAMDEVLNEHEELLKKLAK